MLDPLGGWELSVCVSLVSCQKHLESITVRSTPTPTPEEGRSEPCPPAPVALRGAAVSQRPARPAGPAAWTRVSVGPPGSYAVRMCAARLNGGAEEAAAASRMPDWTDAGPRVLRGLETGTLMTLFQQKKSQRPERRTFHVRPDMRVLAWSRNPDKTEGESEYYQSDQYRQ